MREGRFTDLPPHHEATLEALPNRVVKELVHSLAERADDRYATAARFADQMDPPQRGTQMWTSMDTEVIDPQPTKSKAPAVVALLGAAIVVAVVAQLFGWSVGATVGVTAPLVAIAVVAGVRAHQKRRDMAAGLPEATQTEPAPPRGARTSHPVIESVAVLPFADMSPDHDQEYFSDGIAEELLNALAKIDGLRVAARTSSFHYKGQNIDVREIGEKLGVQAILEGSVRKSDTRVRITGQLVSARDGFHIWSDTYDRDLSDVFAVQEEIAKRIVAALRIKLAGGELTATTQPAPGPEAHDLYLLGRFHWNKRTKKGLTRAAEYFR